jgi:hypothetical protein
MRHASQSASDRVVDGTVQLLRRHRREQLEVRLLTPLQFQDRDPVFASGIGTPLEPGTILRTWASVLATAGVGHVRWRPTPRTPDADARLGCVHPKVVTERLGLTGVGVTLDTDSHVLPELQAAAAEKLDGWLEAPALEDAADGL